MKRKIYDKLKQWKDTENGESALLVQGARRVGKSYVVEEFAKKEYKSYILIDFNEAPKNTEPEKPKESENDNENKTS